MRIEELVKASDEAKEIIGRAMGNPTPDRTTLLIEDYIQSEDKSIYGAYKDEILQGLVGVCVKGKKVVIGHIATSNEHSHKGVGRAMVEYLLERYRPCTLHAETDDDAIDFYKRTGFSSTFLAQRYSGVNRYHCQLSNN